MFLDFENKPISFTHKSSLVLYRRELEISLNTRLSIVNDKSFSILRILGNPSEDILSAASRSIFLIYFAFLGLGSLSTFQLPTGSKVSSHTVVG